MPRAVVAATSLLLLGALGCSAGVRPSSAGSGGAGAVVGQGGSKGGSTGAGTGGFISSSGGGGGDIVVTGTGGMISQDGGCMADQLTHTPTLPTVFVLVDQSGSEFTNATTGTFFTLRTAVLQVIQQLQGQVRFALGVFTGNQGTSPKMCPIWTTVAPSLNNYSAINTVYSGLGQPSFKAETPAVQVIPLIQQTLAADTVNGPKFILFATDSETDFCDDGSPDCPADAVTYQLQTLYAGTPSIGTLVIGLPYSGNSIAAAVLQNFANAGAGQPCALPTGDNNGTPSQVYYACNGQGTNAGTDSWSSLYAAAGHAAADLTSIAAYSATPGTAPVYTPTGADTQSLVDQISTALNTIPPSCIFDLSTLSHPIKVDLTKLNEGGVFLNGTPVPLDPSNMEGWDMINDTELELFGSACTTYQSTQSAESLNLQFPCDLLVTVG